jgi:ligand-binding sensor domain-containing protein
MSATDYREIVSTECPFKDKQGIIWFGGMNGITYFNPQDIINRQKHGISGLPTFSCITIR